MSLRLGPADHGQPVSDDDAAAAEYQPGYKYEIIDGRVYVSPEPNLPEDSLAVWAYQKLLAYQESHPKIINYVTMKARVFVPGRRRTTCPEPDIAAYENFPRHRPRRQRRWQDISPLLAVEVLTGEDPNKDLVRNVALFRQVPTIKEYWVFDDRPENEELIMHVYRRRGRQWQHLTFRQGETYTTPMLPGFQLLIDPEK
jgi:Uma2 family endonuclease